MITEERARQIIGEIQTIIPCDLFWLREDGSPLVGKKPMGSGQRDVRLPITLDGKTVGIIGVTGEPSELAALGSVIRKMVELMLTERHRQELSSLCEASRSNFVEQWLFGRAGNRQSFEDRARLLGIDLNVPRILAVFAPKEHRGAEEGGEPGAAAKEFIDAEVLRHIRISAGYDSRTLCFSIHRSCLVLFADREIEAVRRCATAICNELRNFYGLTVHCGISSVAEDYQQVSGCYREAQAACRTAASGGMGFLTVYNDMSPLCILQSMPRELIERLERAVFRGCQEAEKEEMLHTLMCYFRHDGNSAAAAAELYIHPNTFLYRLKKVAAATGLEPRRPKDMALLYLVSLFVY